MKEFLLVPKKDMLEVQKAYYALLEYLRFNNNGCDLTAPITVPIWNLVTTKYGTATDFAEPEQGDTPCLKITKLK